MGNSSSSSSRRKRKTRSRTDSEITASRVSEQAFDSELFVSEAQVDQVFSAMKAAFDRTTTGLNDVEKEMLLAKLCSKFQEEYPTVLMATTTIMEEGVVSPAARKKRKHSKDTRIIQKWAIPLELLLFVARFLPRSSLNKLKLLCKRIHQAIDNPVLLTQPWGTKCPFQVPHPDEFRCPLGSVIFSDDGSLVAVFTEGDDEDVEEVPGTLQVWDRNIGLIGEFECATMLRFKPVFAPDNQLLLFPPRNMNDGGIRVCYLPRGGLQAPIVVSSPHYLNGVFVHTVAFFDNATIALMEHNTNGIKTCHITRDNDQITLTEPVRTTLVDPVHSGAMGQGWWNGRLASFSNASKDIVAFVYDIRDRTIILHDRRTNASVARPIPVKSDGVLDVAFSLDGNRLVVAHYHGGLSVFDCNGDSIDEIGEARAIISLDGSYYDISFSPRSASEIVVAYN